MNKNLNKSISMIAATVVLFGSAAGAFAESGYVHGRTLKVGSRGESVKMLQEALNSCFGSDLTADGVFGRGTRAEVIAAQKELGVTADGIVGRMSGAKIAACEPTDETTTTTTTGTTTTTTTTTTGGTTTTDDLSKFTSGKGMEVRFRNFQVRNASQAQAEEGAKGVEVARFTFDVQQSDALLERLNVYARSYGTVSPTTPWRVFDKLTVMVNGKEAGSVMTSDASAWDDLAYSGSALTVAEGNQYKLVLGNLATVLKKDSTADIRIIADLNAGANGQTADVKWNLFTDANGIRVTDEAAITQYTGLAGYNASTAAITNAASFTIKNVGSLTTARLTVGANDPKSMTFEAKKNAASSDYTIQEYTLKAEDGDIKIKTLPISIKLTRNAVTGANAGQANTSGYGTLYGALIDSAWVTVNGEKYDSIVSKVATTSGTAVTCTAAAVPAAECTANATPANLYTEETNLISLDVNRRVVIKAGETATVKVMVKFKSLAEVSAGVPNLNSGAQIMSATPSTGNFALENGTGDTLSTFTGSATGYSHTIRTTGVVAVMGTPTITKQANTLTGAGTSNNSIQFSIPVTFTATGNTFYVGQTAQFASTISGTNAAAFTLIDGSTQVAVTSAPANTTVTPSFVLNAPTAGSTGQSYRLDDGSTKTGTINITLTPTSNTVTTTNIYRAALGYIQAFTDNALTTGATSFQLLPVENFKTGTSDIFAH